MTRGIRLSSLTVGAFRGIGDVLEFDLRAPLTLVFAPNGTGKTTVCEAAEWLLTGQVDRLKDKKDFDASVLRSKFTGSDQKPHVAADVRVGSKFYRLSRAAEGGQSPASIDINGIAIPQRPNDLLALLAPAAATNEAHHLTAISLRQRWLKGTRFLSAEALAALVDTDDETIERRTQIFADLLGIRHLLDAKRQFEKYANELSSRVRRLTQSIDEKSTEVHLLEKELEDERALGAGAASARSEAEKAELLLKPAPQELPPADAPLPEKLEALVALHRRSRHENERRRDAANSIEARRIHRLMLEGSVAEAKKMELKLNAELGEKEKHGQAAAAKVAADESVRQSTAAVSQTLAAAGNRLSRRSAALLSILHQSPALDPMPATVGELRSKLSEATWTATARAERRALLNEISIGLEQANLEAERLRLLERQRTTASAATVSEEELAALRTSAADAERAQAEAFRVRDATAAPVSRLQAAARDLLTHDHQTNASTCPVCAHDWQTAEALRTAIEAALANVPDLARQVETFSRIAANAAHRASEKLYAAQQANIRLAELDRERTALRNAADSRRLSLEGANLPASVTAAQLARERIRLDRAEALAALDEEIATATLLLPTQSVQFLPHETPLPELIERVGAAVNWHEQILQLQLADLARGIEEAGAHRDRLRADSAEIQQRLQDCREQLAADTSQLAELQAFWVIAAPGRDWSEAAFAELSKELTSDQERLARVDAHIAGARAAWDTESRRIRLSELRAAVRPVMEQRDRMTARMAAATRAKAMFQDTYTTISERQVKDLAKVVNPLFARMHANRVYDRINLGEENAFLHWSAHAGDAQLNPGKDFSQGQRQDLALALFLARARSLGGTFFLDEPVTHLDDLNRVGLLDILRATVLEESRAMNLVITTASRALARHLIEKFADIGAVETPEGLMQPLRVIELDGNSRSGVQLQNIYPLV